MDRCRIESCVGHREACTNCGNEDSLTKSKTKNKFLRVGSTTGRLHSEKNRFLKMDSLAEGLHSESNKQVSENEFPRQGDYTTKNNRPLRTNGFLHRGAIYIYIYTAEYHNTYQI